jgi:hypothetical protein
MPAVTFARRRTAMTAVTACALVGLAGLLAGCSGSAGATPDTASSATLVPGDTTKLGSGSGGGISITGTSIQRTGTRLTITAQIHNSESAADELVTVGSNESPTVTLQPPLPIAAGATVTIGGTSDTSVALEQTGRLEPGGTVALSFQFGNAGAIQVFSSFH